MRTVETSIEIEAEPARVWAVLVDFPAYPRWNPFFTAIEGEPREGAALRVTAQLPGGRRFTFRPRVQVCEPSRRLRWRGSLMVRGLFDGTHEFRLAPLPGGHTLLEHSEEFTGVLVPPAAAVLRDTHAGFVAFDRALAHRAEAATTPRGGER